MADEKMFSCERCQYKTKRKSNLLRHITHIHEGEKKSRKIYLCTEGGDCKYQTTVPRNMRRHIFNKHKTKTQIKCDLCNFSTSSRAFFRKHQSKHKGESVAINSCSLCKVSFEDEAEFQKHLDESHPKQTEFHLINAAFRKKYRIYQQNMRMKSVDTTCLWKIFDGFKKLSKRIISEEFPVFQLFVVVFGVFEKIDPNPDDSEREVFGLKSMPYIIKPHTSLKRVWTTIITNLDDRIENLLLRGSGWALSEVGSFLLLLSLLLS